ncbi:MAG TPA: protease pro-enzyme activation domain-containing protein, partial [Ktedonobacteraceae bacterium]|nr:protease pro-enzyme activation domain-containing protein [Ktedonobacteraceae bacterium]
MAFGLMVVAILASACSLPGSQSNTSNNSNTGGNGQSPKPTATSSARTPVASTPPATGKLPVGTPLPQNEIKSLTFNLAYNDAAMNQDVAQIYTPGSPTFHQFLSSTQIVQKYALSDAAQQQVVDWLTGHGYSVDTSDALHTSLKVHATVATIEHTLNVTLSSFTIGGHTFFMQQGTPTLPASIAPLVASVVGLDNFAFPQFKPPFGLTVQGHSAALSGNCTNYGAQGDLTRDKIAGAYQVNQLYGQGFQGQGMTIGVAEFGDAYNPQDLANYAACVGLSAPNVQNVNVDGQLASGNGQGEAIMDLELI